MSTSDKRKSWVFPDVSYMVEDGLGNYAINSQIRLQQDKIEELTASLASKEKDIEDLVGEIYKLNERIELHKATEQKMLLKIDKQIKLVTDRITQDSIAVIKKVTKKIISDEFINNSEAIKSLVTDVVSQIRSDDYITIELARVNYEHLKDAVFEQKVKIVENKSLQPGDVIATCNTAGLMMKIEDALERYLGK